MKKKDRVTRLRLRLDAWRKSLDAANALLAQDAASGNIDPELLKVRRSIMRRISRLRRLIDAALSRRKMNSLRLLQNAADNAYLSGVENGK